MRKESTHVAIVSGAARGIGAAITAGLIARDVRVIAVDIDDEALIALEQKHHGWVMPVRADATSEEAVENIFSLVHTEFGRVDAVFANAGGVGVRGPLQDTDYSEFQDTVQLLLSSVFLMFKHGIRAMRPQGFGSLVATASVASLHGGLGPHAYTAAKHGVKGLVESAAVEIAPYGLTANAVAPGGTVSSLSAGLYGDINDTQTAYDRLAAASASGIPTTSEDVAAAAIFLALDAPRINGATLVVDGGDYVLPSQGRSHYESQTHAVTEGRIS